MTAAPLPLLHEVLGEVLHHLLDDGDGYAEGVAFELALRAGLADDLDDLVEIIEDTVALCAEHAGPVAQRAAGELSLLVAVLTGEDVTGAGALRAA